MSYTLFLDDVRDPKWIYPNSDTDDWVICRSVAEAEAVFDLLGWPQFVSFDHDLGPNQPTGLDLAKALIEWDLDMGDAPADFGFEVHSANPVGAANIRGLLDGYLRAKTKD